MSGPLSNRASEHLWNWTLALQHPKDADEYRVLHERRVARSAGHLHAVGLAIGILGFVANHFFRDAPRAVQFACAFESVILPGIPAYLSLAHAGILHRWYDQIVILNQGAAALVGAISTGCTDLDLEVKKAPNSAMHHLLFKSPLMVLFLPTIIHRTSFRRHFLGQLFIAVVSHGWVHSASTRLGRDPELLAYTNAIGSRLDSFFGGIGLLHISRHPLSTPDAEFPPWMVAAFFHLVVGVVIPCAVKYITECYSLAKFLAWKYHEEVHRLIWSHFADGVVFVGFASATVVLMGWIMLRGLAV